MVVIGDVHGCLPTLIELEKQLPHTDLCFTGDLIDRGSRNADTVQYIIDKGYKSVLGNHEELMIKFYDDDIRNSSEVRHNYRLWVNNGGHMTLSEYDERPSDLKLHLEWMKNLPLFIEYENKKGMKFVISHSTVGRVWKMKDSNNFFEKDSFRMECLWSRDFDFDLDNFEDIDYNIIGHTPQDNYKIEDKTLFIDTACVYKRTLTAYDMETGKFYSQPFVG